jgi:hypothetical protein
MLTFLNTQYVHAWHNLLQHHWAATVHQLLVVLFRFLSDADAAAGTLS